MSMLVFFLAGSQQSDEVQNKGCLKILSFMKKIKGLLQRKYYNNMLKSKI
jgi:hypothetical protein